MAVAIEEGYTCNAGVRTWVSEAKYKAKYTSQELFDDLSGSVRGAM